ncbi:Small ribosomal subunit bioproteinsis [Savitreella phatthalungensis]
MSLRKSTTNDVAVYTVSGAGSKSIPDWLARRNKRQLRKDADYRQRIELLQDFEFPEASNCLRVSRDGQYIMATGTYKPHIRLYELSQLSLKFERHSTAENISFELLSDDWTKSVHLQSDRSIDLHTAGGIHYSTRIPTFGRAMSVHYPSAEVIIAAASSDVYRLNLDQGRFMNSLNVESATEGVNTTAISPAHGLLGFGTQNGTVEFWDPRYRSRIGLLDIDASATALSFANDGLSFAVGSSAGITTLYDLRSPRPLLAKDQGYGLPIKVLHWIDSRILSADSKIIKLWERSGKPFTSIEPPNDINDVQTQSGLIFVANEGIPMHTFYVPALGPAPRWCSFLDNLTEELEETEQSVYANYKFVTRKELADLALGHLVGTNVVRPYMHGFFIDFRLYEKARLIADPFAYRDHREKQVAKRIEKEASSRIRTKVNNRLAKKLPQVDDRFASAFTDDDYRVDEASHEFAMLNPTRSKRLEESEDELDGNEVDRASEKEDDLESDASAADEDEPVLRPARELPIRTLSPPRRKEKRPRMRPAEPAYEHRTTVEQIDKNLDFGTRLAEMDAKDKPNDVRDVGNGEREMTFHPTRKRKGTRTDRRSASGNVFRRM